MLVVQVLGQIDLRLRLMHDCLVLVGDRDDVNLPPVLLLLVQRSLAHANSDLRRTVRNANQCDQMAKLRCQYLAIYANENLSNVTNMGKSISKILSNTKNPQIIAEDFYFFPKWRNSEKFGHTDANVYYIYNRPIKYDSRSILYLIK